MAGKRTKAAAALALCLSLLLTACGGAGAPRPAESPEPAATPEADPEPSPLFPYERATVYVDGLAAAEAYRYEGELYLPLSDVCKALGFQESWQGDGEAFTATVEDAVFTAARGDGYMVADGRYLYLPDGWLCAGDRLFLPAGLFGRLLGTPCTEENGALYLSSSRAKVISGGSGYYDIYFDYDDLYWLAHVIYAEAHGQPLAGMIGVGNVVYNRVKAEEFPDSVMEVVYDVEHVVQFEPVSNGSIRAEPDEEAYIAAYLCLEGFNTVGESLYFVNPAFGSGWFDKSLELVTVIGDHNFYQ